MSGDLWAVHRHQHAMHRCSPVPPTTTAADAAAAPHRSTRLPSPARTCSDMPLAAAPQQVAAAFEQLELPDAAAQPQEHREALERFVACWLRPAASDLLPAALLQLAAGPPPRWLPRVTDPEARRWAEHLYHMWGALCRQVRLFGCSVH